jgi:hypothetical protein
MAALSVTKPILALCAAVAVAVLAGCDRRFKTAESVPERPPLPTKGAEQSLPPTPVPATPSVAAATPQPPMPQPTPANDAKTSISRVRARLKAEFGTQPADLKNTAKLHAVWSESWHPGFDAHLESVALPEVGSGQVLPPEIMEHLSDTTSAAELFAKDQAGFVSDRKEFEAAYALTLIASSVCMGSGAELPAFLTRAGSLPPTKGDVVVFRALADGLLFLEHPAVLTDGQFNGWLQLATARNPVYRLLAARTVNSVSSDLAQRSAVYRRLLNDSDPAIARIAVTGASRNVTPETSAALIEFRERQNRLGNADLAETAAKALARVEKHP